MRKLYKCDEQSRETGKIGLQNEETPNKNTKRDGYHFTQANTNNVNMTCAFLQTTGGKDEPNIVN
jgi:fructose/tagatose bisphosphate aldolase